MIRKITGEVKDEGSELKGNINTNYDIKADWKDNGQVVKSWIVRSGQVVKISDGPHIELNDVLYKFPADQEFLYIAVDQAGNRGQQRIQLHINVPELTIEEIKYAGASSSIVSRMSDTIDKGIIQFERQRNGTREKLDPAQFPVKPLDPVVEGKIYPLDEDITIKDAQGKKACSCNGKNLKLTPESGTSIQANVDNNGKLQLNIIQNNG